MSTDDDLLHWAMGLDPIPSVEEIETRVFEVISAARSSIPASLQKRGFDIWLERVSEGYKVSSGKVLLFVEFVDENKYQKAGVLSGFFAKILMGLSGAGLDTSVVLLHNGKATAALTSSANPGVVFFQKDDFDPDRPNVASSLKGARATPFTELRRSLDALTGDASTRGTNPLTLSPHENHRNQGARRRSCGEGVSVRSLPEGEAMTKHVFPSQGSEERIRYLASAEFTVKLTSAIERAIQAAIARHKEAGLPAHGEQNGVIIEYNCLKDDT